MIWVTISARYLAYNDRASNGVTTMIRIAVLLCILTSLVAVSKADTLAIYNEIGPADAGPGRGTSMAEVEQRLGAPAHKTDPVGDPPISVWTYPDYKIYFEHNAVLHVTAKKKRQPTQQ